MRGEAGIDRSAAPKERSPVTEGVIVTVRPTATVISLNGFTYHI